MPFAINGGNAVSKGPDQVSRACLSVCPVCGSQCKKKYHGEQEQHECPNAHTSRTKESGWEQ